MADETPDSDVSELAQQVVAELDPGTTIGSKVILSRRQFAAITGGTLSLGALATYGADEAQAQAVGSVGTDTDRVDVFAYDLDVANSLNGGGPLSDGDGTERQLWVIANGAGDPSGADPEDIILEETA